MVDFAEILEGEPLTVAQWRLDELLKLGVSADDAELLALGDVDLRRFEAIIGAGCPPELAVCILA